MQLRPVVLLVEDIELIRDRMKVFLTNPRDEIRKATTLSGFDIDAASTGVEAEELLKHGHRGYEAIILDLKIPADAGQEATVEIGWHVLSLIRSDPKIAVVICTDFFEKDYILRALQEGATDFVRKPASRDEEDQLFFRVVKAVGQTRENTFAKLRLEHERRIASIERRHDREEMAEKISGQMSRIAQSVGVLELSLSKRIGLDCDRDAEDPICRSVRAIKDVADDVHRTGWSDSAQATIPEYVSVDVAAVLNECLDRIRPCYANHEVTLDVECSAPLWTVTFVEELREIIDELLFSVLQPALRKSTVSVRGSLTTDPNDVLVTVKYHGDAVGDECELLKRIVNNVGGRLEVVTGPGHAEFALRIPVITHG